MNYENLPGSWSSTANALEVLAFLLKDVLFFIDDWVPQGSRSDVQRSQRDANRVLRSQANHSGRLRCNRDGTPNEPKPPRGLIGSTGEAMPEGKSLNARCMRIEVKDKDILYPANLSKISACQMDADQGLYAGALAGFVDWLRGRLDQVRNDMGNEMERLRQHFRESCKHARTATIAADCLAGFQVFLDFAEDAGAIDEEAWHKLWERLCDAIEIHIKEQGSQVEANDLASQFCQYLADAILSGRANVEDLGDGAPRQGAAAWGWKLKSRLVQKQRALAEPGETPAKETTRQTREDDGEWDEISWSEPRGTTIGWINFSELFLIPSAAFKAAQEMASACNRRLPLSERSLGHTLREKGLLVTFDEHRTRNTTRINAKDRRVEVLHLKASSILPNEFYGPPWLESDYTGPPLEDLIEERQRQGISWRDLIWE